MACPGTRFVLHYFGTEQIFICRNNGFQLRSSGPGDPSHSFGDLQCEKPPQHTAKNNSNFIDIGFQLTTVFIIHIKILYDRTQSRTIYTEFFMSPGIQGFQKKFPRSFFIDPAGYFPINLDLAYRRNIELDTFETLLGSSDLARRYINSDSFINRGHLVSKCDFVYGSQQSLTFYYVNSSPQWERCNSGNWNNLEMSVRNLSARGNDDLRIFTGKCLN